MESQQRDPEALGVVTRSVLHQTDGTDFMRIGWRAIVEIWREWRHGAQSGAGSVDRMKDRRVSVSSGPRTTHL